MFEGEAVEKVVFSQEAEGAQAWFRLTLEEDKTYGFSYSFDGRNFYRIEYSFPLKRATWTGAKLCLWSCSLENRQSDGYCAVSYTHLFVVCNDYLVHRWAPFFKNPAFIIYKREKKII